MNGVHAIPADTRKIAPEVMVDGQVAVLPSQKWDTYTPEERARFCVEHGVYGIPTWELVVHLARHIEGHSAIEIGAGHGVLGKALGIPATDNMMQANPIVAHLYRSLGQSPASYGGNVIRMDAHDAVAQYRPDIIIASWVTHRYNASRHEDGGNMFGPDVVELVKCVREYVFIGNEKVHASSPLWKLPHIIERPSWLKSRALNGSPDFIAYFGPGVDA